MYKEFELDEKLKEQIIQDVKKTGMLWDNATIVGLNDDIGFKCTECGACCHDTNIILSPIDIYYISKLLNVSTGDFIDKYTKINIGSNSGMPIILLNKQQNNMCVFHEFDIKTAKHNCKLGDSKPYTCACTPFGSINTRNQKDGSTSKLFFRNNQCGIINNNSGITVGEYIKSRCKYDANEKSESNELLTLLVYFCKVDKIINISKVIFEKSSKKSNLFYDTLSIIVHTVYSFDVNRPFMEQVIEHKRRLMYIGIDLSEKFNMIAKSISVKDDILFEQNVREYIRNIFDSEKDIEEYCNFYKIPDKFSKYW